MIIYNQAFDLYYSVYRMLQLLNKFEQDTILEIDRVRIWDFYFLFPNKVHEIRLKQNESDIRKIRNTYIKQTNNPYEEIPENKKVFEKIKPYQLAAFNCIASFGIIDKEELLKNNIRIADKQLLENYISKFQELSPKEKNVISLMTSHFLQISLYGTDGLKSRTKLIESKYDA